MKPIKLAIASIMVVLLCGFTTGCKKACDDLADICGKCSSNYKAGCDLDHDVCDVLKGKSAGDCCESALDSWESVCN